MLGCSIVLKLAIKGPFSYGQIICVKIPNLAPEVGLSSQLALVGIRHFGARPYANPAFGAGSRSDDVTGGCAIVMTSALVKCRPFTN